MPQLLVRNLQKAIVEKLRERAAKDGVSVEEEHRRVLSESLLGTKRKVSFCEYLLSIPGAHAEEAEDVFTRGRDFPRKKQL